MTARAYRRIESPIQQAVTTLYQSCGMLVYQNSVYGGKPIGVTPGIPDLRVKRPDWRLDFDHETKAPGKRQSCEQDAYMRVCQTADSIYVLGGTTEALDFLAFLQLGSRVNDTIQFHTRGLWDGATHWWRDAPWQLADLWYATPQFRNALDRYGYKPPRARKHA